MKRTRLIDARALLAPAVFGLSAMLAPGSVWLGVGAAATLPAPTARADTTSNIPDPVKVTEVEGITEYTLGNGMRVLLFPDPATTTVTVNITYFVGSRHEGYGETGMAHLLEHMVFKGTPKFPQVWKALNDHGAQFNGTTWLDRTNYYETLTATDENLEFALQLEADRMVNSFIKNEDLQSEFSVVRNEFEMGENNPQAVLSERMVSTAYLWHNYGNSTIGSKEDIERVPVENLRAFYRKYYQPDNAMLVVAGKFQPEPTLKRINELFGSIPRPDRVLQPTYTVEPTQDGERHVILRRNGDVQACGAVYHIPAAAHPDYAAIEVLVDILTTTQTGRLYQALVEPQLAVNVTGFAYPLREAGMVEFGATVRLDKDLDTVHDTLLSVVESIAAGEITQEEVDRSKSSQAKQFELLMSNSQGLAITLTEAAAAGDWRLMFHGRDVIEKVTVDDVKRVAARYFVPSNRTSGKFIPTKEPVRAEIPAAPDVGQLLSGYTGNAAMAQGESIEADPLAIEARVTRTTLPSGIKAALLPKETRGDRVNLMLTMRYGTEADMTPRQDAIALIGTMLNKGTDTMTRRQIQDELDRLQANVGFGGGPGALVVSVDVARENLMPALDIVEACLKRSAFPEKEFDKIKKQRIAQMESQLSEPQALGFIELQRTLSPWPADNIRYVPTVQESIDRMKAVTLDQVVSAYKDFIAADHAELAAVGDFDPAELTARIDSMVGQWKNGRTYERVPDYYKAVDAKDIVINTPDKQNSIIALAMNLELRDDAPQYPAVMMANTILGASANSRLLNRLRQQEGLSYGCGSFVQASSQDNVGAFFAYGICNPDNAVKAQALAREEIEKFLRDGVTQQELDDARKGFLDEIKVGLSDEGAIMGMLAEQTYLNRTMQFTQEQITAYECLTLEQVNSALRQYVDPSKLVAVRAGDFERKPQDAPADGAPAGEGAAQP